ncbi:39S mitochondrial ribosomal protein L46-domain-containing protein [Epithele typhae]|uniref:39S mitochondrial ribosomal protein L46-domain-containing protein n=1 Tax=Epithele typhae TaxID=378194 RepID=UPI0020084E9F|nr:39S mitochondrial ribosomal protein L46-domain-containing protein [Epithele typhae]KAH9946340.1 39S mitochondrial ribosomal protein L46-domain-containing protein [Epithele typhae]
MFSRSVVSASRQRTKACVHAPSRALASVAEASSSTQAGKPSTEPVINAAVVLNRSPIITRTPTPFERAYYAYQSRIRRALFNPFPADFYFKSGTLLEKQFERREKIREREAFGGKWSFKDGRRSSNVDEFGELPVGAESAELGEEVLTPPAPRVHESDRTGDVKSLDRMGERNLYLLVQGKDRAGKSMWRFPEGSLEKGELLHQAAVRDLYAECGENMDAWMVGRKPIAMHQPSGSENERRHSIRPQAYTFFLKGHILAGQVRPGKTVSDFAWLTKEEIESRVDKAYWASVKDILADF